MAKKLNSGKPLELVGPDHGRNYQTFCICMYYRVDNVILLTIWRTEEIPGNWTESAIIKTSKKIMLPSAKIGDV